MPRSSAYPLYRAAQSAIAAHADGHASLGFEYPERLEVVFDESLSQAEVRTDLTDDEDAAPPTAQPRIEEVNYAEEWVRIADSGVDMTG